MAKPNEIKLKDNFCKSEGGKYSNVFNEEDLKKHKIEFPKKFSDVIFPDISRMEEKNIHCVSLKESKTQKTIKDVLDAEILHIKKRDDDTYFIKTGNYLGVIYDKESNLKVEITSRFGDQFLNHMLNYINDIYLPDINFGAKKDYNKKEKPYNQFQLILAHLYIQSLEKSAAIFGLPKVYTTLHQQSFKIRGKLDIKKLMNHNIPLRNKLHSTYREQSEIQEIIDVLHNALQVLDRKFKTIINARVLGVKQILKEKKSTHLVNNNIIQKAKNHNVLLHPSYQSYKKVLRYAEMIIRLFDFIEDENEKLETKAYLFDATELFEIYIEKLLQKDLPGDWSVKAQEEIKTYDKLFFKREMRPDLVLQNNTTKQVLVFDVKYKKMNYNQFDVDRTDFFQIHTYMSYYFDDKNENKLVAGGLLYPIEDKDNKGDVTGYKNVESEKWLGNSGKFVIDGIALKGLKEEEFFDEKNGIYQREKEFVDRIKKLIAFQQPQ